MQKKMVLKMIGLMFPAADHILIDIPGNIILARCTKDQTKDVSRPIDADSQYIPMLGEAYEINNLTKIEIDMISKEVTFIGDKTKKI